MRNSYRAIVIIEGVEISYRCVLNQSRKCCRLRNGEQSPGSSVKNQGAAIVHLTLAQG